MLLSFKCRISLKELLEGLHLHPAAACVPASFEYGPEPVTLPVAFLPTLPSQGIRVDSFAPCGIPVVCTRQTVFALAHRSPLSLVQLAAIATEHAVYPDKPLLLCTPTGLQIGLDSCLPPVSVLVPSLEEPEIFAVSHLSSVGRDCTLQIMPGMLAASFPASQSFQAWADHHCLAQTLHAG